MAVVLGLLAAAFYGAADFCGGFATRRTSIFAVSVVSQAVGFVLLAAALPFFHGTMTREAAIYGLTAGVCGGLGLALLYHALSIGKMGVVSPITAVLAATLPVLVAVAFRHEHLRILQTTGIGIALLAIVFISLSHEPDGRLEFSTAGVREAIASGIILGGFYTFLALSGKTAGIYPLLSARVGSVGVLVIIALISRSTMIPAAASIWIVLLAGVLDMTANGLYIYASYAGYLSIAAVLTSLYPASTVLLAWATLKERLATIQKVGVALALAGVALIAS